MKKSGKQFLLFFLIISLLAGIVSEAFPAVDVQAAVYGWDGTTKTEVYSLDDVYWISSPDELAWFASEVNGGNKFTDKTIYITDYIDLNNKPWTPIGKQIDGEVIFENCTIQRLNCQKSTGGLFGNVTVKNLKMKNVVIEDAEIKGCDDSNNTQKKGIIGAHLKVAQDGNVNIDTVAVSGSIDRQTKWSNGDLGGLFGQIDFLDNSIVTLNNAYLDISIDVSGGLEGATIAGVVAVVGDGSHQGQLHMSKIEINDHLSVKNSYGYTGVFAGGMIGYTNGGNYFIDQCLVKGSVYASSYEGWAGGIAAHPTYKTMQITNTCVSASVSANFNGWYGASHNGGGLLGYSAGKDYDSSFISNCLVIGKIGSGCAFVAHASSNKDIKINNSVFDTQTTGLSSYDMYGISKYGETSNNSVLNSRGYTTSELKSAELFENWDTESIWSIKTDSYPQLYWLENGDAAYGARDLENKNIIYRVSEYTSDAFFAQYDAIMKLPCSDEKRYQLLANLCVNYGLTDPKEGIEYISNPSDKRESYVYLTNNKLYMAYQLRNFLVNGGAEGAALRGLLVVDGLVFNGEIGKWMKPTTYIDQDFPWVDKYKNMLYDFMETGTELNIIKNEYIMIISDLAKKAGDTYKIKADNLIREISDAKDINELLSLVQSANMQDIYVECTIIKAGTGSRMEYKLSEDCGFGLLYKQVSGANNVIKLVDLGFDEFVDFMMLDSRLAVYQQYRMFLEEIRAEKELDYDLRLAAEQIINEIDDGALGKVKELCLDLAEYINGVAKITSTAIEQLWEEMGVSGIKGFLDLIDLASFFSNMIVDMGEVVKYEAYVEGYAQLGILYSKKLENAKSEFLNNRSEENAWEFFRLYNLLYRLRIGGEDAYIQMLSLESSIPLLGSYGVSPKLDSVKQVIAKIKRYHQFTMDEAENVPLSSQFAVKTVIKCPVDVEIYTPDGTLITTLVDGVESDITNEYGRFAVVRDYAAEDYKKVICFNQKEDYILKIIARDDGLVSLETADAESRNLYAIDNVQMKKGNSIDAGIIEMISDHEMRMDTDNDGEAENIISVSIIQDVRPIESLALNKDRIELEVGESCLLEPVVTPADSSQQQVCWLSSNEKIVSVADGKINALAKGTVLVNCVSVDNSSLAATCTIVVKEKSTDNNPGSFVPEPDSNSTSPEPVPDPVPDPAPVPEESAVELLYYIVQFDANGGTNLSRSTMTLLKNDSLGILPTVQKKGYSFQGWYTQKSNGGKVSQSTVLNESVILYAHWSKTLKPKKTEIFKLSSDKRGQATVSFKKISGAAGYEIVYSTDEEFKKSVKKVFVSTTTKTLNNLKKNKIYYMKVRTYRKDSTGAKIYGAYSKTKKIKIKA